MGESTPRVSYCGSVPRAHIWRGGRCRFCTCDQRLHRNATPAEALASMEAKERDEAERQRLIAEDEARGEQR